MLRFLPALLLAGSLLAADWYLFTSFRQNGETGVFLALSEDGRRWTALNNNEPWLKPEQPGMLMRDPFLTRGPDGMWRLLWTWGWTRKEGGGELRIGYAESRDLIQWSRQRAIPVFSTEPTARNVWAPEAVWDDARGEWIVFWSTTIPGRFPATDTSGDSGYNHRLYAMTTRDWKTFSEPKLWFDPGFNAIDATVVREGRVWRMVFKDERLEPLQKRLRTAVADSPAGPWRNVFEPFTPSWVEGPSVVRIGDDWWIYYDHYRAPRHYGATVTRDWKTFREVTEGLSFPEDHRHGTVVRVTEAESRALQKAKR